MVFTIGIVSVVSGTMLACQSQRFPAYVRLLEIGAGFLLIGGLALSSRALPVLF
jgi:hypothetical protein